MEMEKKDLLATFINRYLCERMNEADIFASRDGVSPRACWTLGSTL